MYEVDEHDQVVELGDLPQSCIGAPLPVIIADELHLYVAYIVEVPDPNWDGTYARVVAPDSETESVALVQFSRPSAHFFGPPNDEAFAGHPLAGRGLHPYGAFEVKESSWVRTLERRNSVHRYHSSASYRDRRHFVLTFHDSTFECIAREYGCRLDRGSVLGAIGSALRELK